MSAETKDRSGDRRTHFEMKDDMTMRDASTRRRPQVATSGANDAVACAIALLEVAAETGIQSHFPDGGETPNAKYCREAVKRLRAEPQHPHNFDRKALHSKVLEIMAALAFDVKIDRDDLALLTHAETVSYYCTVQVRGAELYRRHSRFKASVDMATARMMQALDDIIKKEPL